VPYMVLVEKLQSSNWIPNTPVPWPALLCPIASWEKEVFRQLLSQSCLDSLGKSQFVKYSFVSHWERTGFPWLVPFLGLSLSVGQWGSLSCNVVWAEEQQSSSVFTVHLPWRAVGSSTSSASHRSFPSNVLTWC
jgi:hypothetical protein